jgi:hypothetical protein
MVQMAIYKVVHVITMRYGRVATVFAVNVSLIVRRAVVAWRTFLGIRRIDVNAVLVEVIAMSVMQVAVVKIVGVAVMPHSHMAAVGAMHVGVSAVMLPVSFRHAYRIPAS